MAHFAVVSWQADGGGAARTRQRRTPGGGRVTRHMNHSRRNQDLRPAARPGGMDRDTRGGRCCLASSSVVGLLVMLLAGCGGSGGGGRGGGELAPDRFYRAQPPGTDERRHVLEDRP